MKKHIRTHATLLIAVTMFTFACGKQKKNDSTSQNAGGQALANAEKAAKDAQAAKDKAVADLKHAQEEYAKLQQSCPGTQCAEEKAKLEARIAELEKQNADLQGKSSGPQPAPAPAKAPAPVGSFTPEATSKIPLDYDGDVTSIELEIGYAQDPSHTFMVVGESNSEIRVFDWTNGAPASVPQPIVLTANDTNLHLGTASEDFDISGDLSAMLFFTSNKPGQVQKLTLSSNPKSTITPYIAQVLDKPISPPVLFAKFADFKRIDKTTKSVKLKRDVSAIAGASLVPAIDECEVKISHTDSGSSDVITIATSDVKDDGKEEVELVFKTVDIVDQNNTLDPEQILGLSIKCEASAIYQDAKDKEKMVVLHVTSYSVHSESATLSVADMPDIRSAI